MNSSERNSNIEILRFILMFFICLWHMLIYGMGLINMRDDIIHADYTQLALLAICVPSVNCFMLISGYYGIRFSVDKFLMLVFSAIIVYWGTLLYQGFAFSFETIRNLFPVSSRIWWFLSEYMLVMLLSPFLNEGAFKLGRHQFGLILMILLFINSIGRYLHNFYGGYDLISMIIVYLIGRYMFLYKPRLSKKKSVLLYIGSFLGLFLLIALAEYKGLAWICWLLLWYCNPLIILEAIGLLYLFLSFHPHHSRFFQWVGKHCFSIYLLSLPFSFNSEFAKLWNLHPLLSLSSIFLFCCACIFVDVPLRWINDKFRAILLH